MSIEGNPSHARAVASALLVTFLWSSSWVLIRWGLDSEDLEPIGFAALRYGLAALILIGWTASTQPIRHHLTHLDRRAAVPILLLGVVFYAVTQGAQFVAIDSQPAATTSLVLSLTPLLVALLGGWSLGEKPSRRQFGGALLVAAGAWSYFSGDLGATAIGLTAALIGLGANVTSALLGRHVNRQSAVPPVVVTTWSMATGAAILFAVAVAFEGVPTVSPRGWLIILWLALVNTALAFTLWNLSLRRLSALESAAINNTLLIQIAVLAWILLDETPGRGELIGIALVSVGVLLTQGRGAGLARFLRPRLR